MSGTDDIKLDFDLNFSALAEEPGAVDNKPVAVSENIQTQPFSIVERIGIARSEHAEERRKTLLESALALRNQNQPRTAVAEMPVTETLSQTGSSQSVVSEETNLQPGEMASDVPTESKRPIEMEIEPDVQQRIDSEHENEPSDTGALDRKVEEEKTATQAMLNQQLHSLALLNRTEKEEQAASLEANKSAAVATQQRIETARKARDEAKRRVLLEEELKSKELLVAQRERELQGRIAERIAVAQRAEAARQERMAEEAAAIEAENRAIAVEKVAIERASVQRAKLEESKKTALKSLLEKQAQERELLKRAEAEAVANLEVVKLAEYAAQQRLDAENDARTETRRRTLLESELRERELVTARKERELQAQIAERLNLAIGVEAAVQEQLDAESSAKLLVQQTLDERQTAIGKVKAESIARVESIKAALADEVKQLPENELLRRAEEQAAQQHSATEQITVPEQSEARFPKRSIGSLIAFSGWAVAAVLVVVLLIQLSTPEEVAAPVAKALQPSLTTSSEQAIHQSIIVSDAENVVSLKMTTELPQPRI
ncbi:MAG: hypothetical protein PXX77_10765 [Gallionella sp.]|nr:hypothetical protein [Gallionella sp.]